MRNYKTMIRSCLLYVMAMTVAAGVPLTALATTDPVVSGAPLTEVVGTTEQMAQPPTTGDTSQPVETAPVTDTQTQAPLSTDATVVVPLPISDSNQTSETPHVPSTQETIVETSPPATSTTTHNATLDATNNLASQATTGNTAVTKNTTGGSATSGDAAATTTVINTVHSTIQGDTAGVAHFTADIHGNVVGDITLSPILDDALKNSASSPLVAPTVNANQTSNLTNNISLGATSGNADVTYNTTAGNATTGSADTVANIVNLINTIIAANQSFVGTINIYGNLDGDILISSDFIPQLLASNASSGTGTQDGPTVLNVADTQSIVNNVNLDATSGHAGVFDNTTAGNATTGTAKTNLTILNYAGRDVVASNSLLIFVNVLGQWVGLIVDAPAGATAAVLGNGVTGNTAKQLVDADTTSSITNNIDLTSVSGDATVQANTRAGNATSGDATASANIANISTSTFSLSDWFGVLFINVFGTWYGSFGVNTANGTVVPLTNGPVPLVSTTPLPDLTPAMTAASAPRFGFVPRQMTTSFSDSSVEAVAGEPASESVPVALASTPMDAPRALVTDKEVAASVVDDRKPNIPAALIVIASLVGLGAMAGVSLLRR